eukprot:TRINITY_DN12575_c0_g4_i1.p1 TRINITY_DN12575_c0_g4~~TRINITY_DN12575_c0_g4_i1.p1  ORF type:complete len:320 (-),score=68.32 TRINITY_DN12575_c0_g4_i1:880-1839(-)
MANYEVTTPILPVKRCSPEVDSKGISSFLDKDDGRSSFDKVRTGSTCAPDKDEDQDYWDQDDFDDEHKDDCKSPWALAEASYGEDSYTSFAAFNMQKPVVSLADIRPPPGLELGNPLNVKLPKGFIKPPPGLEVFSDDSTDEGQHALESAEEGSEKESEHQPESQAFPSIGSSLHGNGCKPCSFFWRPMGCHNGAYCLHCHLCPKSSVKQLKKQKIKEGKAAYRTAAAAVSQELQLQQQQRLIDQMQMEEQQQHLILCQAMHLQALKNQALLQQRQLSSQMSMNQLRSLPYSFASQGLACPPPFIAPSFPLHSAGVPCK